MFKFLFINVGFECMGWDSDGNILDIFLNVTCVLIFKIDSYWRHSSKSGSGVLWPHLSQFTQAIEDGFESSVSAYFGFFELVLRLRTGIPVLCVEAKLSHFADVNLLLPPCHKRPHQSTYLEGIQVKSTLSVGLTIINTFVQGRHFRKR
jgi:hypothetical protein